MSKGDPWTDEEIGILFSAYSKGGSVLAYHELIEGGYHGRTLKAIGTMAKKYDIYAPEQLRGFSKGHVPYNKGKGMSAETRKVASKTWFRKGHLPKNHAIVGTKRRRRRKDPKKRGYWWIKVAEPNKWELYHRWLWKRKRGAIPKGLILVFKDGDQDNVKISNLELITRSENVRRNDAEFDKDRSVSDSWIAGILSRKNPELKEEILKDKELINLKRVQLRQKKKIDEMDRRNKKEGR